MTPPKARSLLFNGYRNKPLKAPDFGTIRTVVPVVPVTLTASLELMVKVSLMVLGRLPPLRVRVPEVVVSEGAAYLAANISTPIENPPG